MHRAVFFFGTLISLISGLTIPTDSSIWPPLLSNSTNFQDPEAASDSDLILTTTNLTIPPLGIWPPLPFTSGIDKHLSLTINQIGPNTSPDLTAQILGDLSDIYYSIARQGSSNDILKKFYSSTRNVVTVFFGSRPHADLKRHQAVRVVGLVHFLMLNNKPREILISDITSHDEWLAVSTTKFLVGSP